MSKTTVSTPEAREDVGERPAALGVGVVDGQPGGRVVVAPLGAAGLRGSAEAVLGAEDGGQLHPGVRVHHVDDVPYSGVSGLAEAGGAPPVIPVGLVTMPTRSPSSRR